MKEFPWPTFDDSPFVGFREISDDERKRLVKERSNLSSLRNLLIFATIALCACSIAATSQGTVETVAVFSIIAFPFLIGLVAMAVDYSIKLQSISRALNGRYVAEFKSGVVITAHDRVSVGDVKPLSYRDKNFKRRSGPDYISGEYRCDYTKAQWRPMTLAEREMLVDQLARLKRPHKTLVFLAIDLVILACLPIVPVPSRWVSVGLAAILGLAAAFRSSAAKDRLENLNENVVLTVIREGYVVELLPHTREALVVDGFPVAWNSAWVPPKEATIALPEAKREVKGKEIRV